MEVIDIQVCVGYIKITTEDDGLRLTEFLKMVTYTWVPIIRRNVCFSNHSSDHNKLSQIIRAQCQLRFFLFLNSPLVCSVIQPLQVLTRVGHVGINKVEIRCLYLNPSPFTVVFRIRQLIYNVIDVHCARR